MTSTPNDLFDAEMNANYAAFNKMSFKESDKGKFALLHKRELITICDSHSACCILGDKRYTAGLYSVQEIGYDYEKDLGVIDYALPANRTTETKTPAQNKLQAEVDANFEAFNKMSFKESDKGKFALLRDCKVVAILDAHKECRVMGLKKFADGLYSI